MRNNFTFLSLTFIFLLFALVAHGQTSEKTLVKSFNVDEVAEVSLNIGNNVEVVKWSNKTVRVQMNIIMLNGNVGILKSLIRAGRYNLRSTKQNDKMTIYAPGLQRKVTFNDSELREVITYIVYAPEELQVIRKAESSSSVEVASKTGFSNL